MTTYAKDGVIDYPIADGMSLAGVWNYVANANGPSITAKQGYFSISRGAVGANNQWTNFSIGHSVSIAGGCAIQFEVKYDQISPATEVKLTLASGVILRYDGSNFNYCWWNQNGFHQIGRSTIRIADGAYHQVTLCLWPAGIAIFEDGNFIGKWDTSVSASVAPHFDWQILSSGSSLSAQLRSILVIPSTFAPGVGTPWDVAFSDSFIPPADIWQISKQKGDPIPISFSADGFMRAETRSLNKWNSWVFPQVTVPMTAFGLVMYRFRVNTSNGSETKITLMGDNILRITSNGSHLEWDKYTDHFIKLSDSSIRVGGGWTVVTLVYSQTSISLFEDGVYKYTRTYSDSGKPWEAHFWVQHLDTSTAVSVDLSNVRCVPLKKTAEMLIRDLQPTLLAYYPLKTDVNEAICTIPALDLAPYGGYKPKFVQGKFGNAADFSGQGGALKIPLYPYGRSFPSYTLSFWVKVDSFPAQKAGLVGPLSVRSDGKLEFTFVYSEILSYKDAVFTSHASIPRNQWVSIVVTYAYEESRFAIFLDGVLDSIVYTTKDNSSQAAVLPMYGYVGALAVGDRLNVLDGQIGDVFFFRQHVHNVIALALANKSVTSQEEHAREKRALFIPLLLPAFLVLAYGAISTAVLATTLKETQPGTLDLEEVVSRIVQQVGSPARPGAQVKRSDIGISDDYPITLDIGGEGPLEVSGLVTGFPGAININEMDTVSVGAGGKIPYLVKVARWATNPGYPFADNFADQIVMMGCPLTPKNADEMVRVIKPTGTIDVWISDDFESTLNDMARRLKSYVRTPKELARFSHNGHTWFTRRQIVANKNGHDDL